MNAPQGWNTGTLHEVAHITMGQSPDSKYYSEEEIGLPFLQGCAEFQARFPLPRLYCSNSKKIAKQGAILFSVRAPVGRQNIAERDYVIGRGLAAIQGKQVAQPYLEHFLASETPNFSTASQGSTFEAINSTELASWPVIYPDDHAEQSKIAEVLSKVDSAIAQTEALIAKQQRIKTGLMQDLLTRGIDEHGQVRTEASHAFKDSPLGRIPVEWDVMEIDQLVSRVGSGVTPTGGESVYTADGILFLRSQNVHFDGLRLDDVAYIPSHIHHSMMRSEVVENDVLLNITGASIGRCCRMPKINIHANTNQHVCTIRLRDVDEARAGFLAAVLQSHIGQHQIGQLNAGGNREGLNYQQVRSFHVPWPSDRSEFVRIYDQIKRMNAVVAHHSVSLDKLRHLKTALMQDLLTGKVRVTHLLLQIEAASA
ncbi:restriction endonuclease subunit S [Aquilutibacter rugosus]|uniref:restriction endonuclease subunit S n=1 Tax=Aquilutibacter rugosus TaxID=3115820 RepID=UPI002F3E5443